MLGTARDGCMLAVDITQVCLEVHAKSAVVCVLSAPLVCIGS